MIIFISLIVGCLGWIMVFVGWWIPDPYIAFVIGGGLFIFLLIEAMFLRKRNAITFSTLLTYANIALGCWVFRFWQSHGYPSERLAVHFFMLVAGIMSAILVMAFIKGRPADDKNRAPQKGKEFKTLFAKRDKKSEDTKEVSIAVGESIQEEKQNPF